MKKFIAIDVDGVLTDGFHTKLISFHNERTKKEPLIIDHLHDDIREYFHKSDVTWKEGREFVFKEGFVLDFEPKKEAIEFIYQLRQQNIPFKICTAPYVGHRLWMGERAEWLKTYFDVQANDVIFARDKSVVAALSLIDDKISNCVEWSEQNEGKTAFLISQPWNIKVENLEKTLFPDCAEKIHYSFNNKINMTRTNDFKYILETVKRRFFKN